MIVLAALLGLFLLSWGITYAYLKPLLGNSSPAKESQNVSLQPEIVLNFKHPIRTSDVSVSLSPSIAGSIRFEHTSLAGRFAKTAVFVPSQHLDPHQNYTLTALVNQGHGLPKGTIAFSFQTQGIPSLASANFAENQQEVAICDPITLTLDQENLKVADFNFSLTPKADFEVSSPSNKQYILTPKGCLTQNTAYTLHADRSLTVYSPQTKQLTFRGEPISNFDLHFTTHSAPTVTDTTPTGTSLSIKTSQVSLHFSRPMSAKTPEAYASISPKLDMTWKWQDTSTLVGSTPTTLSPSTTYTVTVKQGLPDTEGGFLNKDNSFSFKTIDPPKVTAISPSTSTTLSSLTKALTFSFDQTVDRASAEKAFSLSPTVAGSFSWQNNTLSYTAQLENDTTYTATIRSGVLSPEGVASTQSFSTTFSTPESMTLLNIALDKQDHNLTCEVASLKMALGYRDVSTSEESLMSLVGYDTTASRQGNVWGDPSLGFVGSIDGTQDSTGYGVYWDPIAKAANNYRSSSAFRNASATQLAGYIAAGNPVIVWGTGVLNTSTVDSWTTPGGKTVNAWKGEHVRLVIGYYGSASNPSRFIINDPITGRITWSTGQFMANWNTFSNSGVVVY